MPAKGWDRIYREKGDLHFKVLPKVRSASRVFKTRGCRRVLDLGCGTGKHTIFLARQGFTVYATDLSSTGIDITREKAKSLNIDNIHFKQHDMRSIPFTDGFFDAVICTWTIFHGTLDDIRKTIGEILRVLRADGMLLTDFLSTSDSSYGVGQEVERNTFVGEKPGEEDVPHHYTTREELVHLFAEFADVKIRSASNSINADDGGKRNVHRYYVEAIK